MAKTKTKKDQNPISIEEKPSQELIKKEPFRFGPGNNANPAGRPKGSRNKLSEKVIADLLADWEVAGPSAIQACRLEDPAAYVRIVTSLIPKEFNFKQGDNEIDAILDQFTGQDLDNLIVALASISAPESSPQKGSDRGTREKPNGVH